MKILIFGASGSGTTTLGKELGKTMSFIHLDADDYYWEQTEPPFQKKVPLEIRNQNLKADFNKYKNVIVSGSMVSWGKEWEKSFDLAIFIYLNSHDRMERLKKRELKRYGGSLKTDKTILQNSKVFLEWAKQYDNPTFKGRSLKIHDDWIKLLNCEVLRIKGEIALDDKVKIVLNKIKNYFG